MSACKAGGLEGLKPAASRVKLGGLSVSSSGVVCLFIPCQSFHLSRTRTLAHTLSIRARTPSRTLGVTAVTGRAHWVLAVTGAAHAVLAPFWRELQGRGDPGRGSRADESGKELRARQCSPRGPSSSPQPFAFPPSLLLQTVCGPQRLPLPQR